MLRPAKYVELVNQLWLGFCKCSSLKESQTALTSPQASMLPGPQPVPAPGARGCWRPGQGPVLGVPISPLAWLRQLEGNGRSVLDIQSDVWGPLEGRNPVNVLSLPAPKEMARGPFLKRVPLFPRQTGASSRLWGRRGGNGMSYH